MLVSVVSAKEAVLRTGCLTGVTGAAGRGDLTPEVLAERLLAGDLRLRHEHRNPGDRRQRGTRPDDMCDVLIERCRWTNPGLVRLRSAVLCCAPMCSSSSAWRPTEKRARRGSRLRSPRPPVATRTNSTGASVTSRSATSAATPNPAEDITASYLPKVIHAVAAGDTRDLCDQGLAGPRWVTALGRAGARPASRSTVAVDPVRLAGRPRRRCRCRRTAWGPGSVDDSSIWVRVLSSTSSATG